MRAFAPGSVTTVFAPTNDGAHGISFATADGVVADVTEADGATTAVTLDGEATSFEPVELACASLGVDARVDLTAQVPVGRGFGASGAATLATVLAVDAEWDLDRDRSDLVEVAARAEIEAGTGLGDVYVQERGGLVWNVGEGRRRRARTDRIGYESFGPIATDDVLGDAAAMDRIRAAASGPFERFDPDAPLGSLFDDCWAFAEATGLVTERVGDCVEAVQDAGGAATMAMVGETVVSTDATDELANETRIGPDGARVLE